jgi:hypothetical protein
MDKHEMIFRLAQLVLQANPSKSLAEAVKEAQEAYALL